MENQFGKLSQLHLTASKKDGKTILEDVSFTAPFKIMRPFYEKKDLMTVMLMSASAGIMAGDCQEFHIRVREGAQMEFVSQAYEKIHKMNEGYAQRKAVLYVEPHATLYYTPLPAIPFAESDYRSTLDVHLADETSRFVFSEVLTCGRLAHGGERFAYRRFSNRVSIYQKEKIIYRDNTCYEPAYTDMEGYGMYEGFTHLANLVICNDPKSEDWILKAREMLDEAPNMEGGVTRLSSRDVAVRILGMSAQKLTTVLENLIRLPGNENVADEIARS